MQARSRLDEIEDYDFTVRQFVYKNQTEFETRILLAKRGIEAVKIDELINMVKANFSGVKFIQSRKYVRLINYLIDIFVLGTILFLVAKYFINISEMNSIGPLIVLLSIVILYYIPSESIWGVTVGKIITGSKVVNENYEIPKWSTILIRTLCRLIPNPWWIDNFFHDRISKTFVVNRRRLNELKNK